jgi:hypothetical protein
VMTQLGTAAGDRLPLEPTNTAEASFYLAALIGSHASAAGPSGRPEMTQVPTPGLTTTIRVLREQAAQPGRPRKGGA